MKIVILDGYTTNPGDVSWEPIKALGSCEIFDRTAPYEIFDRSKHAEIIITNKVILERNIISMLPKLKYIGVIATGYNVVDLELAKERNIIVTNVPNYCTSSVAQMVFAHIFELTRRVGHHARTVKQGKWTASRDFCYWDYPQIELSGKILGIFGYGTIGKTVASIAINFGMKVIAYDVCKPSINDLEIEFVDFDTFFNQSDIISLHCPLTKKTKEIINKSTLSMMKKTAFLINTARGPLVNENDLANALNNETIAGAGLDVLNIEPPAKNNPLFKAKNCYITPHIAWASRESRKRLIKITATNIKAFLDGEPVNVVN